MELRVLQYFLAVAREGSITKAASSLHLSQPTLSRQIQEMERELGKKLLNRETRKITLTDEGQLLKERAEEILQLAERTENEIASAGAAQLSGRVYIGAGETYSFRLLSRAVKAVQDQYPKITFDITSSGSSDLFEKLEKGLLDFALVFGPVDQTKYHMIRLAGEERWGVLMKKDAPLAQKKKISPKDLADQPLLLSKTSLADSTLLNWMHKDRDQVNIRDTYNLIYNGSLMVEEGIGYALTIEKLINVTDTDLAFRLLDPPVSAEVHFVWKKYQTLSKAAQCYLDEVKKVMRDTE